MIHTGRELGLIEKHVRNRNVIAGEFLLWYQFRPVPISTFDDVYDEGASGVFGRQYLPPVKVPTIYAEEREDAMVLREDGRKPTQNAMFTILVKDAIAAKVESPGEYRPHLNDILYYDNRFYKIFNYVVTGRLHGESVIRISCYEVFLDEEFVYDSYINTPLEDVWPSAFPSA